MLSHKTSLNKFKNTEIILSIFSDNGMKFEITFNNRRKTTEFTKMWKLNNMLLNNQWVKEKVIKEFKKYFRMNENKNATN